MTHAPMSGRLATAADVRAFALAGNATLTLVSEKTGARYTYRIRQPEDMDASRPIWFVSVMYGSDNEGDFAYMGQIRPTSGGTCHLFAHGRKSKLASDDVRVRAFLFAWAAVQADRIPAQLEIWHEGKCGRCGRKLTVPQSIAQGFGPECVTKIGRAA